MDTATTPNDRIIPGLWSEKIQVITDDYEIIGHVFMPKTGKKNRVLSDILNGSRRFIAIKNVKITDRRTKITDESEFIQLNLDSIILLKSIL